MTIVTGTGQLHYSQVCRYNMVQDDSSDRCGGAAHSRVTLETGVGQLYNSQVCRCRTVHLWQVLVSYIKARCIGATQWKMTQVTGISWLQNSKGMQVQHSDDTSNRCGWGELQPGAEIQHSTGWHKWRAMLSYTASRCGTVTPCYTLQDAYM